jgi:CDP-diacylglycerol---glycerol-3-phosphate 3-phosphatidyltransferase
MNLANKLTMMRIFLVPVFLIFIAIKDIPYGVILATAVFAIAALTDKLDGYIARSRNQVTRFGKLMDPLADKLLISAALISLVEFHIVPAWGATIIIAREFAVTGLRSLAASEGIVIAASVWGKAKTVTQIVAIILALLNLTYGQGRLGTFSSIYISQQFLTTVTDIAMYLAIIITILSGMDYFSKNKELLKADK